MARVQLVLSDGDRDRYVSQAKREGKTLSAWLREAAQEKIDKGDEHRPFASVQELEEFFRVSDAEAGPERELDWEEYKQIINESRSRGDSNT